MQQLIKTLNQIGVAQLSTVLYTFLKRNYTIDDLSEKEAVFQYLYQCLVVFDLIDDKGASWFIQSSYHKPIFYEAIAFFEPVMMETIKNDFYTKKWSKEDYHSWYKKAAAVQGKAAAWVLENPAFLLHQEDQLQAIHQEQQQHCQAIKDSSRQNRK